MQNTAVELALGRIFGMMQRATRPGDVAEYERCRLIVLNELAPDTAISGFGLTAGPALGAWGD